jgi:hypothetical protein
MMVKLKREETEALIAEVKLEADGLDGVWLGIHARTYRVRPMLAGEFKRPKQGARAELWRVAVRKIDGGFERLIFDAWPFMGDGISINETVDATRGSQAAGQHS